MSRQTYLTDLETEAEQLRLLLYEIWTLSKPWPPTSGQIVARNPNTREWRAKLDEIHILASAKGNAA